MLELVPAGHSQHADSPMSCAYVPGLHEGQYELLASAAYDPSPQSAHAVAPIMLSLMYLPGWQLLHAVAAYLKLYVPAGHGSHEVPPLTFEYVPG